MTAPTTAAEIVDAFLDALVTKRFDDAIALVSDDCEYDNVPMLKVHGPEAIKGMLEPMMGACEEIDWVVHRSAAQGNLVFNERLDRFCTDGKWLEIPVCGVFEITDGKISLWRDYFDLKTYTDQT